MILEGCAEDAQSDRVEDQAGDPENVQSVLGLPDAVVEAFRERERNPVVDVVAVNLDNEDADPVAECECRVLFKREAVAVLRGGFLDPYRDEGIDADVEPEAD